ncbi:hypothetical protein [Streptomyces boncukensis]|uniref:Uncharacterized protein n=1 Tax=Streptomyces boncukensis TaxID=2711219 RepID=A0A6G4WUX8_9ACTN|nr:hypothetical protein [Streptomyces boncukensis]NGO68271.1 hypothetical protein [Streptomyces boncukensis]
MADTADAWHQHNDLTHVHPELRRRLSGEACAYCGATDGLRDGELACRVDPDSGRRVAYRMRICPRCPQRAATEEGPS